MASEPDICWPRGIQKDSNQREGRSRLPTTIARKKSVSDLRRIETSAHKEKAQRAETYFLKKWNASRRKDAPIEDTKRQTAKQIAKIKKRTFLPARSWTTSCFKKIPREKNVWLIAGQRVHWSKNAWPNGSTLTRVQPPVRGLSDSAATTLRR